MHIPPDRRPQRRRPARPRWVFALLVAAAVAAACDKGGELREVTERRRAELANRDTTGDGAAGDTMGGDSGFTIPTFVGDTPVVGARADSAAKDSARAEDEWTTRTREVKRGDAVATVRGYRVAARDGFDRLVLDFGDGPLPGWHAEYLARPLQHCASGEVVQVPGQAWLLVRLRIAHAHDDAGAPTVRQRDVALGLPAMRQLVLTCDFEGDVEVVLGLSSRSPYRVLELQNPARLVIDVKQNP